MTIYFTYKYSSCTLEYIPNDISIKLTSYLIDSNDQIYINPNTLSIDTFDVQLYKSSLPTTGYANYLAIMAGNAISNKYSQTVGGYGINGRNIITQMSTTENLIPGLYVYGDLVPADTLLMNIRDTKSIELSKSVTATGNITLALSTNGWKVDYTSLDELITIIDFSNV
jgi:hypothetical protein